MEQFRLAVKDKGRTVLPVGLQHACGFSAGAALMARPLGPGRFIVETEDAILDRIWSRLPTERSETDAVEDLARWRETAAAERQTSLETPELGSEADSPEAGARLLQALGLE